MRHDLQVELAVQWLRRRGCIIALAEPGCRQDPERPDAIGWTREGHCTVIECKRTRKDFLAEWTRTDRKDFRRIAEAGLGHSRIYFTTPGVISEQDLDGKGWGLAEIWPGRVRLKRDSVAFSSNRDAELRLILASVSNGKHETKARQLQLGFPSQW